MGWLAGRIMKGDRIAAWAVRVLNRVLFGRMSEELL